MQYKKKSLNKYSSSNKYRLAQTSKKNKFIIIYCYFFSGVNFTVAGICSYYINNDFVYPFVLLGVIMFLMVPISIYDTREEMNGLTARNINFIVHFSICIFLSYIFNFWWMAVYALEIIIYFAFVFVMKKLINKKITIKHIQKQRK